MIGEMLERREVAQIQSVVDRIQPHAPSAEVRVHQESTANPWIVATMPQEVDGEYLDVGDASLDKDQDTLRASFRNDYRDERGYMRRHSMSSEAFGREIQLEAVEIAKLQDEARTALRDRRYSGTNFVAQDSPPCKTTSGRCSFDYRYWPNGKEPSNVWLRNEDGSRFVVPSPTAIDKIMGSRNRITG